MSLNSIYPQPHRNSWKRLVGGKLCPTLWEHAYTVKARKGEIHLKNPVDAMSEEGPLVLVRIKAGSVKTAEVVGVLLVKPLGPVEPHKHYFKQQVSILERLV